MSLTQRGMCFLGCGADEIDAIAKARGDGPSDSGTQEREQGLLQLLTGAWGPMVLWPWFGALLLHQRVRLTPTKRLRRAGACVAHVCASRCADCHLVTHALAALAAEMDGFVRDDKVRRHLARRRCLLLSARRPCSCPATPSRIPCLAFPFLSSFFSLLPPSCRSSSSPPLTEQMPLTRPCCAPAASTAASTWGGPPPPTASASCRCGGVGGGKGGWVVGRRQVGGGS